MSSRLKQKFIPGSKLHYKVININVLEIDLMYSKSSYTDDKPLTKDLKIRKRADGQVPNHLQTDKGSEFIAVSKISQNPQYKVVFYACNPELKY